MAPFVFPFGTPVDDRLVLEIIEGSNAFRLQDVECDGVRIDGQSPIRC